MIKTQNAHEERDDFLWQHLKTLPAFRAFLRAVEARFYHLVDLPEPVLDMGCGDGNFVELAFDKKIAVGIDPWWGPLNKAVKADVYDLAIHGFGDNMPFPDEYFGSVFSNSVLEHIPQIQPVLNEMSRVCRDNGRLLFTTPSDNFTKNLWGAQLFEKLHIGFLATAYRKFFNYISRHERTDNVEVWHEKLNEAGWEIERWQYYFSPKALHALEFGHAQGLPSAILQQITGHWIIAPWRSNLRGVDRWLRPFFEEEPDTVDGAYLLIIAKKIKNGAIQTELPPANPFPLEELLAIDADMRQPSSSA